MSRAICPPDRVNVERASQIFSELRTFWSFVDRQYGLANAREILASLDHHTAAPFEKEFANPVNFGMAKSFVMMGTQAGFDMTTRNGLAVFLAAYNAGLPINQPTPLLTNPSERPALSLPRVVPGKLTGDALKNKRKEEKRQRAAKKRNRPH